MQMMHSKMGCKRNMQGRKQQLISCIQNIIYARMEWQATYVFKVFKTNLTQSQQLEKHEKQASNTDFSHICLPCTTHRQLFLATPHRLHVSVGLPMYRLSPITVGCASSSSCVSWFAYVPLIVCNLCPNQYKYSPMSYAQRC